MRGQRAGHVAARVQMRDVEGSRVALQIIPETEWQEELQMISQAVREIGEHPPFHSVHLPLSRWHARRFIAGIRRAHRDLMAASGKPAGETVSEPWYAPVRPGIG